ncbi:MAG: 3-keto-5-aminohexanoate cleavage protein [Alphaproteobacteria bacterium]
MILAQDLGMMPLMVSVAPTGARKSKQAHPALPITPDEIAETARACLAAGASMIHLHVRDRDGQHSIDVGAYRDACDAVRDAVGDGLIIQVTSEAVGRFSPGEQMAMVRSLRPQAVSLAIRELVATAEEETVAREFFRWSVGDAHILLQYILYSPEDVARFLALCSSGVIPRRSRNVLFVLGRYTAGQRSAPRDLLPFLAAMAVPDSEQDRAIASWSVCAFGAQESACALTAAALGGHVRVGFENNLQLADGSTADDNASLVAQVRPGAALLGRPLAGAAAARQILGAC